MSVPAATRKRTLWKRRRNPTDDLRLRVIDWMSDVTDTRSPAVFAEDNYVTVDALVPLLSDKELVERVKENIAKKKDVAKFLLMKKAFAKASTGNMQATKLYKELSGDAEEGTKGWADQEGYQDLAKMSDKQLNAELARRLQELQHVGEGKLWKLSKKVMRRRSRQRRETIVEPEASPVGSA